MFIGKKVISIGAVFMLTATAMAQTAETLKQPYPTLTARQQAIVAIASYTGRGDLEHLPSTLIKGLEAGMTVNEIKEFLVQAYAYCGFPRSIRAIQTFMHMLDQRKADGIVDVEGRTAAVVKEEGDKYERGAAILEKLSGINSSHPKSGYGPLHRPSTSF